MKNIFIKSLLCIFILLTFTNCTTNLTAEGEIVDFIMKEEAPKDAEFLGIVESGLLQIHFTQESVINDLRNKVAELGGNLLVVDTMTSISDEFFGYEFKGMGRAYRIN